MCSKTRSLSQKRDTALQAALHAMLHAALHAFSMSFSTFNLFFDLSTQKPTQRCMQRDVAFVQRCAAGLAAMCAAFGVRGRLHGAFLDGVFMSDKPFVAEACPPMSHASALNGLSDINTHIENAPCYRPLSLNLKFEFKY
jgi:hypothetical protein